MSRQTRTIHLRAPLMQKCFFAESRAVRDPLVKKVHRAEAPTKAELEAMYAKQDDLPRKLRWKEVMPVFDTERANRTGGATILLTGDPDNENGLVEVQVAFCSKHDPFSRKRGRQEAGSQDKYVIKVTDIPRELHDIEDQMLCQLSPFLSKNHDQRVPLYRPSGWAFAMYYFLPKNQE